MSMRGEGVLSQKLRDIVRKIWERYPDDTADGRVYEVVEG